MFNYWLIYNILFLPYIHGNFIPALVTPKQKEIKHDLAQANNNKLTQNVITEGGAILPSNPIIQLKDHPMLITSEDELSQNKNRSIVGRKGVNYTHVDDVHKQDSTIFNSSILTNNEESNLTMMQPNKPNDSKHILNNTQKFNITKSHKPLILSHEALVKMDKLNNLDISEDNVPDIKVHSMKAGSHPGMIMPIVITILVVPMFAVIGFMAITRGREAWKNRHYKRMDFLLDGMYNE
ncbi:unnamed protein product, partial [Brenthis ino]